MITRLAIIVAAVGLSFVRAAAQSTAVPCNSVWCFGADSPASNSATSDDALSNGIPTVREPSVSLDTETTILDHLKSDPNYANLFVKEPGTTDGGTNGNTVGTGSGVPSSTGGGMPAPITEANALDHLKNNPAYAELLKNPSLTTDVAGGESPAPGSGLSGPDCVSYYTYVCDKDLPGAKDDSGQGGGSASDKSPAELASSAANSMADFLTGDQKDACEALLCLSSGERPGECDPPIARYLSIIKRTAAKTAQARADFLKLCPISDAQGPKLKP